MLYVVHTYYTFERRGSKAAGKQLLQKRRRRIEKVCTLWRDIKTAAARSLFWAEASEKRFSCVFAVYTHDDAQQHAANLLNSHGFCPLSTVHTE